MTISDTTISNTRGPHPLKAVRGAVAKAVQADTTAAHATFRARGTSTGPVSTTIAIGRHSIHTDEPAHLGGKDTAPNPMQYALVALVSCQLLSFRFWAAELGVEVDDLDVDLEAHLDARGFFGLDEHTRPGFGRVTMSVQVSGPETPERYAEVQAAVDEHCPVMDVFTNGTVVDTIVSVD